jgi:hypothetical protein
LSREIKDILDELHIMLNIKSKQQRVLKDFRKHVEYILAPEVAIAKDMGTARVKTVTALKTPDTQKIEKEMMDGQALKAEKDAKWTMELATRLSADLDDRVVDLNYLKESAEHTEKAVGYLFISNDIYLTILH